VQGEMETDELIRTWIVEVIQAHLPLVAIAVRQRAKFEGWLKFELAASAELKGASSVGVESPLEDSGGSRSDIVLFYKGARFDIELKTCNANWRMPGVLSRTRPITKNISGIITDAKKLQGRGGNGIVAFCMFPVTRDDTRWTEYLDRIGGKLGIQLTAARHSNRVSIPLGNDSRADVIVVSFAVPGRPTTKVF
jgi:hypothetical protein